MSTSPFPERKRTLPVVAWLALGKPSNFFCEECKQQIGSYDFVCRDLTKHREPGTGRKRVYHVDCKDPEYAQGHEIAREDDILERMRGHKAEVDVQLSRFRKPRRTLPRI